MFPVKADPLKLEAGILIALGMAFAFFGINACGSVAQGMDLACFRDRAFIAFTICLGGAVLGYISTLKESKEKQKGIPLPFKEKQEELKKVAGKKY
jgi:prolipoprotein diacylglyceryltransferase